MCESQVRSYNPGTSQQALGAPDSGARPASGRQARRFPVNGDGGGPMKSPVYRFSEVLRALRNESGLTVLQAAERTGYGNYERWEAGHTRVGPEYLQIIAEVFGVEGDLWLLAYAWLVDRYTPRPGKGFFEFTPQGLKRVLRRLPAGDVDLGEQANLAVRAMGHGQLAVMCLIARYGPAYAGADTPLVLAPTPRTPAPPADHSGCILDRYADVFGDLARYVSRTFLLAGMGHVSHEVGVAVFRHMLLLLAEPDSFALLQNVAGDRPAGKLRGLDGLSAAALRAAPKMPRLAVRQIEDLCRLAAVTDGRPVSVEEMKAELRAIARDDEFWDKVVDLGPDGALAAFKELVEDEHWWLSTHDWPVTKVVPRLPEPDPALIAELQRLRDRLDRRSRRAMREEVADAAATAAPNVALDASLVLRREHASR